MMPATNSSAPVRSPDSPLTEDTNASRAKPVALDSTIPLLQLAKYMTGIKDEAFIGPLLNSLPKALAMLKVECPSLRDFHAEDISLNLQTDAACAQGGFRILPSAWPGAFSELLPLIKVDVKSKDGQAPPSPPGSAQGLKVTFPDAPQDSSDNLDVGSHKGSPRFPTRSIDLAYKAPEPWEKVCVFDSNAKTWYDLVREGALLGI